MAIISQERIMDECWNGERARNCDYCPAHSSKNGSCCFGERYDGDDTCMKCPHRVDCEYVTRQKEDEERRMHSAPRRITISRNNRPQPSRPQVQAARSTVSYDAADGILRTRATEPMPIQIPEETSFIKLVGLHAAWGAVEGMLELLLVFFRRRRPD